MDFNTTTQGINTRLVPCHPRQKSARRPAAVSVHDDGNVVRYRARRQSRRFHAQKVAEAKPQTAMMSCSFDATNWSMDAIWRSVVF